MDGYAGYLLVAYGVTALVVIGNIVAARRQFRRTRQKLAGQLAKQAGRPVARSAMSRTGQGSGAGEHGNETPLGRST